MQRWVGHIDDPGSWANHLEVIRRIQQRTGGFTEFVPLPFVHMGAPIFLQGRSRPGPTWDEVVLIHSVARIAFDGLIPNIQASWVKLGLDGGGRLLAAGCNDMGGTLMGEIITRSAGAAHGTEVTAEEFEAWVGNRYPSAHRGEMMEEGLSIFRSLISDKVSSFNGKYYSYKDIEMFPKPKQDPFPLYIGGHNLKAVERAAAIGRGWLPGWRPLHEIEARIGTLREHAAAAGRDPKEIEIAPQFSLLVGKTREAAEKTYMQSGLVAHRVSLAHTGRDPVHQVTANLVGSPQSIIDKIHRLEAMGVDHCAAMAVAVNTQAELIEQLHWFAEEVMPAFK